MAVGERDALGADGDTISQKRFSVSIAKAIFQTKKYRLAGGHGNCLGMRLITATSLFGHAARRRAGMPCLLRG